MTSFLDFLRSTFFQSGMTRDDAYLADASDCCDLERRLRTIEHRGLVR